MILELLFISTLILTDIFFILKIVFYTRAVQEEAKVNQDLAGRYGEGLIIGLVSGGIVIVLDGFVTAIFSSVTKINLDLLFSSLGYVLGILLAAVSLVLLALFLISYIIYKGIIKTR